MCDPDRLFIFAAILRSRLLLSQYHTTYHKTAYMRPADFATAAVALTGSAMASPASAPTDTAELSDAALHFMDNAPSTMREDIASKVLDNIPSEELTSFTRAADGSYPTGELVSMATSALETITTGEVHAHVVPEASTTLVQLSIALQSTTLATETIPVSELQEFYPQDNDGDIYVSGSAVVSGGYKPSATKPMDVQGGGWWEGIMASSTSTSTVTLVSKTASVAGEGSLPLRPTIRTKPRPSATEDWQRKTINHVSTSTHTLDEHRGTISHVPKTTSSLTH